MSCPYFYPVGQLGWPNAPRLPLGDAYMGLCHADPNAQMDPDPVALRDLCNLGYARGRCTHFPAGAGPDAVRFSVARDAGGLIEICWVRERDHHPFDRGRLEYSHDAQSFTDGLAEASVRQQAQAYVSSYLRRKTRGLRKS